MSASDTKHSNLALVGIGVFKLLKCAILIALGVAMIRWREHDVGHLADRWRQSLPIGPPEPYFDELIARVASLDPRTLREIALGSFVYAGVFFVEGVGLCLRRRWAEFLTVAITASLLPLELYELIQNPTYVRLGIIVINVAIMAYLIQQLWRGRRSCEESGG